jgi:AbrB family looped-hinge helix DNA binding protein
MESVVGEKGQVTIPKPLRDSLGLAPGVRLEFEEREGVLCARKAATADPIGSLWGILPPFDVDAEIEAARGPVRLPKKSAQPPAKRSRPGAKRRR